MLVAPTAAPAPQPLDNTLSAQFAEHTATIISLSKGYFCDINREAFEQGLNTSFEELKKLVEEGRFSEAAEVYNNVRTECNSQLYGYARLGGTRPLSFYDGPLLGGRRIHWSMDDFRSFLVDEVFAPFRVGEQRHSEARKVFKPKSSTDSKIIACGVAAMLIAAAVLVTCSSHPDNSNAMRQSGRPKNAPSAHTPR